MPAREAAADRHRRRTVRAPGEAGFAAFGVLAVMLVVVVGAVLALAVVVAIFAPGASQGCEALDGSGEPVGPTVARSAGSRAAGSRAPSLRPCGPVGLPAAR